MMSEEGTVDEISPKKELRNALLLKVSSGDPETIHKVSRETEDLVVLRAIAKNENTAALTLKLLSVINNKSVRVRVAGNKNTPYNSLLSLQELGYDVPEEVMSHAAKVELTLRKGIDFAEGLPGIYAQQILKTL